MARETKIEANEDIAAMLDGDKPIEVAAPVAKKPAKLNPNKIIEAMKGMELVLNDIDDNVLIMRNPSSKVQLAVNLNNHTSEDAVVALFAYNGIASA